MADNPYNMKAWQRARRLQLTVEPMCRHCAERGMDTLAEHVDHIVPITKGGDWWDGVNLQSLCEPCHSRKTAKDEGRSTRAPRFGCRVDGTPVDPKHHWNGGR